MFVFLLKSRSHKVQLHRQLAVKLATVGKDAKKILSDPSSCVGFLCVEVVTSEL